MKELKYQDLIDGIALLEEMNQEQLSLSLSDAASEYCWEKQEAKMLSAYCKFVFSERDS
jgi:hypothetical protein